jgi:hypothetical protein
LQALKLSSKSACQCADVREQVQCALCRQTKFSEAGIQSWIWGIWLRTAQVSTTLWFVEETQRSACKEELDIRS